MNGGCLGFTNDKDIRDTEVGIWELSFSNPSRLAHHERGCMKRLRNRSLRFGAVGFLRLNAKSIVQPFQFRYFRIWNDVKSVAPVRLQMEFLSQNVANPFAGDFAYIVGAVPVDEPARDVFDGELGVEGGGEHIPDDLQNLSLHIHAPIRDQFLVVLSSQIPEVVSGLRIINDGEEWDENLI